MMNFGQKLFKRFLYIYVFFSRRLTHEHQPVFRAEILNSLQTYLSETGVFVYQIDFVGNEGDLTIFVAVFAELLEPVVQTVEGFAVRQIEN